MKRDEQDENRTQQSAKRLRRNSNHARLRARNAPQLISFQLRNLSAFVECSTCPAMNATRQLLEKSRDNSRTTSPSSLSLSFHSECADPHITSITSVSRLTKTTDEAISKHAPCTTGKSRPTTPSIKYKPTPDQAKTDSTIIEPAKMNARLMPSTFTTGNSPLRKACLIKTLRSATPLARAVRTKSWLITSSMLERT